jgi:pyruvate/2-oxoglutarate dehydrogenase complex dihydrolipoamide acyltransferase (E2) component
MGILLPKLGSSVEKGSVVEWLKEPGGHVTKNVPEKSQPVLIVESGEMKSSVP